MAFKFDTSSKGFMVGQKMWYANIAKQLDELGPQGFQDLLIHRVNVLARMTKHAQGFLDVLHEERLLTKEQVELILKNESKYERNLAAYTKIMENGVGRLLVWALYVTENHHVISKIQEWLTFNQQHAANLLTSQSLPPLNVPAPSPLKDNSLQNYYKDPATLPSQIYPPSQIVDLPMPSVYATPEMPSKNGSFEPNKMAEPSIYQNEVYGGTNYFDEQFQGYENFQQSIGMAMASLPPLSGQMERDNLCVTCGRDHEICQILQDCPSSNIYINSSSPHQFIF